MRGSQETSFLGRATSISLPLLFGIFSCLCVCAQSPVDSPPRKESLAALRIQPQDTLRVFELMRLFDENINKDVPSASKYAEQALILSVRLQYLKGIGDSKRALGDVHRLEGNFPKAEAFICAAIALAEQSADERSLAKGYLTLYKLHFAKGDYKRAAEANEKVLAIGPGKLDKNSLAEAYGNEAISAGIGGAHIRAVELFLQSLDLYRAGNNRQMEGVTLMRIGHTFELAGSYEKALDYLLQALEINRALGSWGYTGWCLLNIGVTHSRISPDDHDKKLHFYHQALEMAEKANDFRLRLACLDNIGGTWSLKGDYAKANRFLNQAYKLSTSAGHNSRTVFITGNLAENYLYTGQLDSATFFGQENLRIALKENNTFEKRQAYSVLSQVYAQGNEHRKAYEMLLQHARLTDSIFNVQKSHQIEELREKYEADRSQHEINMLTKEKAAAEFRRNTFAGLSFLFLVVGLLVFAILKLRERKNRQLLEKEIELDKMKSRFFANISHEFRTPLTLILGPIDELMERPEQEGLTKYLKPMRRNAARLLELVNQLLELSRIQSGTLKPVLTPSRIGPLVKGVVMSFDSLAETREIKLDITTDGAPEIAFLDRDKFEKILTNLLSNAFKYTPRDGRIMVVAEKKTAVSRLSDASECLEIVVQDDGIGIGDEDLAHIFDRFYQADNKQLIQQDGSGIGLALTRELVELHQGTIWADSHVSQGTRITLQIPLDLEKRMPGFTAEEIQANQAAASLTWNNSEAESEDAAEGEIDSSKPLILLIEDHSDVRHYIHEILANSCAVIETPDGEEGVAMALEKIPDLILCDVMMPKLNGFQVCDRLKGEEKTSHIPIILLTAKADAESRIEGLESKADDYLTKPFIPKELLVRIRNLVDGRRRLQEKFRGTLILRPAEMQVNSIDEQFLKKVMDLLEIHMGDEKFGVEALGDKIGMSRSQLHRKLKALIGEGPNHFIRSFRLNRAHDLLKANSGTAAEIAYTVGFASPSYFTKCFHEKFGCTPSEIANHPS